MMKREYRIRTILAFLAVGAILAWFLFPVGFVRGVIVGVASVVGLLAGAAFFIR